jgi:hypothetical protein
MCRRILHAVVSLAALLAIAGCSTSSGVLVNNAAPKAHYDSVYVVTHGGSSGDMDANLQKELLRHGFAVTAGSEGNAPPSAQLVAKYADDWKWDIAMYLRSFDVMIYDSRTNTLLASGSWKNSTFHGFYGSEKVVAGVVDKTLLKINSPL